MRTLLAGDAPFAVSTLVRGPAAAGPDARGGGGPAGRLDGNPRPGSGDRAASAHPPRGRRIAVLRHRSDRRLHGGSRPAAAARHLRRRRRRDFPLGLCVTGRVPRDRHRSPSRLPVSRTLSGRGAHRPQTRRRPGRTSARSAHPSGGHDTLVRPRPGVGPGACSGPTPPTSACSARAPEQTKYSNKSTRRGPTGSSLRSVSIWVRTDRNRWPSASWRSSWPSARRARRATCARRTASSMPAERSGAVAGVVLAAAARPAWDATSCSSSSTARRC